MGAFICGRFPRPVAYVRELGICLLSDMYSDCSSRGGLHYKGHNDVVHVFAATSPPDSLLIVVRRRYSMAG